MGHASHTIRVVMADAQSLFCHEAGIAPGTNTEIQVVGEASDSSSLLKQVQRLDPHVLLVDLPLAKQAGLSESLGTFPTRLVVLLHAFNRSQIIDAVRLGATGMVLKTASS